MGIGNKKSTSCNWKSAEFESSTFNSNREAQSQSKFPTDSDTEITRVIYDMYYERM